MTATATAPVATMTLVHPGIEDTATGVVNRARPVEGLRSIRVGIIENGKWNAGHLLEAMRDALVDSNDAVVGPTIRKQHYNRDLTDEEVETLRSDCDIVLAAIGDCGSCTSYTVRDVVAMERIGIPAVAVVTAPFAPLAASYAKAIGMDDPRIQPITHPLYGIDDDALASRVDESTRSVVGLLGAT